MMMHDDDDIGDAYDDDDEDDDIGDAYDDDDDDGDIGDDVNDDSDHCYQRTLTQKIFHNHIQPLITFKSKMIFNIFLAGTKYYRFSCPLGF